MQKGKDAIEGLGFPGVIILLNNFMNSPHFFLNQLSDGGRLQEKTLSFARGSLTNALGGDKKVARGRQ